MKTFKEFSANKNLYKSIMSRNVVPDIDTDEYPDRASEGLEGPFKFKNGSILYYDPKEGKYYDPKTDLFVSNEEMAGL